MNRLTSEISGQPLHTLNKELVFGVQLVHVEFDVGDVKRDFVIVDILVTDMLCDFLQDFFVLGVGHGLRLCEFVVEGVLAG